MPRFTSALPIAIVCLAGCHGAYMDRPNWNRKVEALSIAPAAGEQGREQVTAFFSIRADEVAEPVDLSTQVELLSGDQVLDTLSFQILAQPAGATGFGCNCPPPLLCWVIDGIPSGCGEAPILCDPFQARDLSPDQPLSVRLSPTGGGVRDTFVNDDRAGIVYPGRAVLGVAGGADSAVARLRAEP